jgi:hypothetical protein
MPARSTLTFPGHAALGAPETAETGGRSATADARRMQAALQAMQESRFAAAFEQLMPLADEGHPQAARMALLFAERGTRLFGGRYAASADQQRAWRRVAA